MPSRSSAANPPWASKSCRVFDNFYARTELNLDCRTRAFEGNVGYVGYVVWTMGALTGSDTFVVHNGKIVAQTGVVFRQE